MANLADKDRSLLRVALGSAYTADAIADILDSVDVLSPTEAGYLDGVTAGTAVASKAVVAGASKEIDELTFTKFNYTPVARTATADGTTTGTIAAAGMLQFVTVTCDDADKIIILPAPTPGVIVILSNGATGYELRSSAPDTVAINGGSGAAAESAIAASTMVLAICTSATTWQAIGLAGTTLAAVEAAA
jgi:hypothetical protein